MTINARTKLQQITIWLTLLMTTSGCTTITRIHGIKIVGVEDARFNEGRQLIVEVLTDKDIIAIKTEWEHGVGVHYSVDENNFVSPPFRYDERSIVYRRPYGAGETGYNEKTPDGFASRWLLRLAETSGLSVSGTGTLYEYNLEDGLEHSITFEVYGATLGGSHLFSNPVTIKVPAMESRKKEEGDKRDGGK